MKIIRNKRSMTVIMDLVEDANEIRTINKNVKVLKITETNWIRGKYVTTVISEWFTVYSTEKSLIINIHEKQLGLLGLSYDRNSIIEEIGDYKSKDIAITVNSKFSPKKHQIPALEYLKRTEIKNKLLPLTMGSGKTYCLMEHMALRKKRFALIIKSEYLNKWAGDVNEILDYGEDDILVIRGSKSLYRAMELLSSDEGDNIKCVIVSNRTYLMYIKNFFNDPISLAEEGVFPPSEFFERCGIDSLILDECHLNFNFNFKLIISSNVNNLYGLSGTFYSENTTIEEYMNMIFPEEDRYTDTNKVKYLICTYVSNSLPFLKSTDHKNRYNHLVYEQQIFRSIKTMEYYKKLALAVIREYYLDKRKPGDKGVMFFSAIHMCTKMEDFLKNALKQENLKISRYVHEDSYDNALNSDLIITNIQKLGAAIDIPNNIMVYLSISIKSKSTFEQAVGRLRILKGREVNLVTTYNPRISKQIANKNSMIETLESVTLKTVELKHDNS